MAEIVFNDKSFYKALEKNTDDIFKMSKEERAEILKEELGYPEWIEELPIDYDPYAEENIEFTEKGEINPAYYEK